MDENYFTFKNIYCNELLDNMQRCLIKCRDNKKTYFFNSSLIDKFNILDCDNITKYQEILMVDTKIKFIPMKHVIETNKKYTLEYNVSARELILDQK